MKNIILLLGCTVLLFSGCKKDGKITGVLISEIGYEKIPYPNTPIYIYSTDKKDSSLENASREIKKYQHILTIIEMKIKGGESFPFKVSDSLVTLDNNYILTENDFNEYTKRVSDKWDHIVKYSKKIETDAKGNFNYELPAGKYHFITESTKDNYILEKMEVIRIASEYLGPNKKKHKPVILNYPDGFSGSFANGFIYLEPGEVKSAEISFSNVYHVI